MATGLALVGPLKGHSLLFITFLYRFIFEQEIRANHRAPSVSILAAAVSPRYDCKLGNRDKSPLCSWLQPAKNLVGYATEK